MALKDYPGFTNGTYRGRSPLQGSDTCVNCYPEPLDSGTGKAKMVLVQRPGSSVFCTLATSPGRGIWSGDEQKLYAVSGAKFYEISLSTGIASDRGTVANDGNPVHIFSNSIDKLGIVANHALYIDPGGAASGSNVFVQTTAASSVQDACFIDGYTMVIETDTNKVFVSALGNMTSWTALDVQTWYASGDRLIKLIIVNNRVWLCGRKSMEAWSNVGGSGFPFRRVEGSRVDTGLTSWAGWALCPTAQGSQALCFLGRSPSGAHRVYVLDGYRAVPISSPAIEEFLSGLSYTSDAVGNAYVADGHSFFILNFPTASAAIAYDFKTGMWHERYSGAPGARVEPVGRYHNTPVIDSLGLHYWLAGGSGIIYREDTSLFTENSAKIYCERTGPNAFDAGQRMFIGTFRLDCDVGIGASSDGVSLECSYDNGNNFSTARTVSTGASGATQTVVQWHRNGSGRSFIPRVRWSDGKRMVINSASIDLIPGSGY